MNIMRPFWKFPAIFAIQGLNVSQKWLAITCKNWPIRRLTLIWWIYFTNVPSNLNDQNDSEINADFCFSKIKDQNSWTHSVHSIIIQFYIVFTSADLWQLIKIYYGICYEFNWSYLVNTFLSKIGFFSLFYGMFNEVNISDLKDFPLQIHFVSFSSSRNALASSCGDVFDFFVEISNNSRLLSSA